jgi:hypothetical protein
VQSGISIAERAFQLARSGTVSSLDEIRRALRREGYKADTLQGPLLYSQLRAIMRAECQRVKPPTISAEDLNESNNE